MSYCKEHRYFKISKVGIKVLSILIPLVNKKLAVTRFCLFLATLIQSLMVPLKVALNLVRWCNIR